MPRTLKVVTLTIALLGVAAGSAHAANVTRVCCFRATLVVESVTRTHMNGDGGSSCVLYDCQIDATRGNYVLSWGWQFRAVLDFRVRGSEIIDAGVLGHAPVPAIIAGHISESDTLEQHYCLDQCYLRKAPGTWEPSAPKDCAHGPIDKRIRFRHQDPQVGYGIPGISTLLLPEPPLSSKQGWTPHCSNTGRWFSPDLAGKLWHPGNYPFEAEGRLVSGRQISALQGSITATCINTDVYQGKDSNNTTGYVKAARVSEERLTYFPESKLRKTVNQLDDFALRQAVDPSDFPQAPLIDVANKGPFPNGLREGCH